MLTWTYGLFSNIFYISNCVRQKGKKAINDGHRAWSMGVGGEKTTSKSLTADWKKVQLVDEWVCPSFCILFSPQISVTLLITAPPRSPLQGSQLCACVCRIVGKSILNYLCLHVWPVVLCDAWGQSGPVQSLIQGLFVWVWPTWSGLLLCCRWTHVFPSFKTFFTAEKMVFSLN